MPKLTGNRVPKYQLHPASGQAAVKLPGGAYQYLGKHGTAESKERYNKVIAEWIAAGRPIGGLSEPDDISINELILLYDAHAKKYYGEADGKRSGEIGCIRQALRVMRKDYGRTLAKDFGPLALKTVQDQFVAEGWSREYVNHQVNRVRKMFRWAVGLELVPGSKKVEGLFAVEPLKLGKTRARETEKVEPVDDSLLDAVLATDETGEYLYVSPVVGTMIKLQRCTGMRPGEVCGMKLAEIDIEAEPAKGKEPGLWLYQPTKHKTAHHGIVRQVWLGKTAQELLRPFLSLDRDAPLFRASDSIEWHRARRAAKRKVPVKWGNAAGTNVKRRPKKVAGRAFTTRAYYQSIQHACSVAFPLPPDLGPRQIPKTQNRGMRRESTEAWKARLTPAMVEKIKAWRETHSFHPNQIRHTRATELDRLHGKEASRAFLGHTSPIMTENYIHRDAEIQKKIARSAG